MSTLLFHSPERYRLAQLAANARKLRQVFACEAELHVLAEDALATLQPRLAVCHGARNGWEVQTLRTLLACQIIGTDIAPTAADYGLIELDFHDCPPSWQDRFDLVYSNSLDHAYDPRKALTAWVASLRPGGRLYLSHCRNSTYTQNEADCYGASLAEYDALVASVCQHLKTLWLGDQRNASGGLVRDLALIVGEKPCSPA